MAKIAKTGDRKKEMDTTKSTDCPKCSKPTRIVKRVKDRERGIPGGVYISCSACSFRRCSFQSASAISLRIASAVAAGFAACVMGLPTTRKLAPRRSASAGVAMRF
jgi:hypothetical protein